MKGLMQHDPDHCHLVTQRPKEGQSIIINTKEHPNGISNFGYFSNNKWFDIGHQEIDESRIMCWHDEEDN